MSAFILYVSLAFIPALIAERKGHSLWIWWLFGLCILPVTIVLALRLQEDKDGLAKAMAKKGMKQCPDCAEYVKEEAKVCRYCRCDVSECKNPYAGDVNKAKGNVTFGRKNDKGGW